jgi:DNA modification methylase
MFANVRGLCDAHEFEKQKVNIVMELNRNTEAEHLHVSVGIAKPMLAEVAVYNEDCRQTMERLQSNSLDLIVTSPPYFNARDYSQYNSVQDYMATMKEIFTLAFDKMKESRMVVVNISPVLVEREKRSKQSYRIPLPFYFVGMMEEIGYEFLEDIIWMKPDGSAPNRNGGFYRHRKPVAYKPNIVTEYVLVFKKPAPFLIDKVLKTHSLVEGEYERTNVWQINPDTNNWHPAPFPEALAERIIKYYSYEGETVYDCFAGSGTVGKVGNRLNRKVILSELKEDYYDKMIAENGW